MSGAPAVSVVIPARDASATIGAALDALAAQTLDEPFEVIVVDNGSADETVAIAERHGIGATVLRRERGGGPGDARNDGAAAATAPVLAFTDSDCAADPDWLVNGLRALDGHGLVQGFVRPPAGASPGPFDHTMWVTSEYGLYETANMFVRREWFDRVGGFEDWINADRRAGTSPGRPFGEDALFAWRARRAGAPTTFATDAVVVHAVLPGSIDRYLGERARDGHFAGLVALVPELRGKLLWRRWFLNERSAAFDLAVAGLLIGAARRSPLALVAVVPWARMARREALHWAGSERLRVMAPVVAAGDAVGFVSRLRGCVRHRSVVL